MPKDIRSYFTNLSAKKIPANASTTRTKKRRVISSDEEEDKIQSPVKRTKKTQADGKNSTSANSEKNVKQEILVSAAAMFANTPIRQKDAQKIKKKTEKQVHNDVDFDATLCDLDISDIEKKYYGDPVNKKENISGIEKTDKNVAHKEKSQASEGHKSSSKQLKTPDKEKKSPVNKKSEKTEKARKPSLDADDDVMIIEDDKVEKVKKHKTTSKKHLGELTVEKRLRTEKSPKNDPFEEKIAKQKQHSAVYQQYLQRGGARNPGSKEIPVGADLCLAGLSFLITGVLDSLEREEAEELIKKYGGRMLHQVSKKTDYVIVGDEPGPSKMQKANSLNIKQISEDDLLEMIRTRPTGKATDVKESHRKSKEISMAQSKELGDSFSSSTNLLKPVKKEINKISTSNASLTEKSAELGESLPKRESQASVLSSAQKEIQKPGKSSPIKNEITIVKEVSSGNQEAKEYTIPENSDVEALVEKYRPKNMKQILGQQGDKSCVRKLYNWLKNWHKNQSGKVKLTRPSPWAKDDSGAFFKAALLSGPPGIGKTSSAQVVCKELGFDLVEFNASDTRSKKLLKDEVSDLLSNTTLKDYFGASNIKPSSKHVLLMDEVDGMAGNEDRGGLQELIALIKRTDIPIICVCNDRNNPKMRTLGNYIFDLRFPKPRLEQIRGAMRSICFKEHINISTEDLDRLIESTNHDVRQIINHLALYANSSCHQEETQKKHVNKDLKLGPWDVVRKVFTASEHQHMSIHDKSNLFFHDYNIAPLFVQENYLQARPDVPKNQLMKRVAETADSLAWGDVVEKSIRNKNAWSLLPVQACYSSVIPGTLMSGYLTGQINFPAWLGRNSKTNKFDRLLQEITVHARLTTFASKEAINLDYLSSLRDHIVQPLVKYGAEGVNTAVNVMNTYHLLREDLDSLIEVSLWPGQHDPMQSIDSKVKASFTRTYNKLSTAVPYVATVTSKKKGGQPKADEDFLVDEDNEVNSDNDDEDDIETDKMIKAKKPSTSKKTETKGKTETKDKTVEKAPAKRGKRPGKGK